MRCWRPGRSGFLSRRSRSSPDPPSPTPLFITEPPRPRGRTRDLGLRILVPPLENSPSLAPLLFVINMLLVILLIIEPLLACGPPHFLGLTQLWYLAEPACPPHL